MHLSFRGARVLPSNIVVAYGSVAVGGRTAPLVAILDSSGRVLSSFYLQIEGDGVFLDAIPTEDGLVAVGYVDSVVGRRAALAARIRSGEIEWAIALGSGFVDFAKSVALFNDNYALAGVTQPSRESDSDVLLIFVDSGGRLREAYAMGTYMYNDFAERCYNVGSALILVGSTWSHNVSYSDALLIDAERGTFITLGGASRDEGFAAAVLEDGFVVVGSTFSVPGSLSEAFYAVVRGGSVSVFSVSWPGYDGFVDVHRFNGKLYMIGYSVHEGRERGLLFRASESGFERGVVLECEGDLTPLALGSWGEVVVAVFSCSGSLLVLTLDSDLNPIRAYAAGYSAPPAVRVLMVRGVEQRWRAAEGWSLKSQTLTPKRVELVSQPLAAGLVPLSIPSREVPVEGGILEGGEPLWKILVKLVKDNVPLLIIAIPVGAIIIAIILRHRR